MQVAPAFYEVATAAETLAKKQAELSVQLLQAQGKTAEATALQRELALAAADPALRDMMQQVWAAEDAAKAEAAALTLANREKQMTIELLKAQGRAEAALKLEREMALAALDPALRGLQEQIWAAEDAAKKAAEAERAKADAERAVTDAKSVLLEAYRRERSELQETADKFNSFSDDLRTFRASLFLSDNSSGPGSYRQAMIRLMEQSGLARGGNEAALGGGVQDAATQFMEQARLNASTLQDVQRARAFAARQVDAAISGAEVQASIAERQLAQLDKQVGKLVDINDNVISVAQAIDKLTSLMFPPSVPATQRPRPTLPGGGGIDRPGGGGARDIIDTLKDRFERLEKVSTQGMVAQNRVARVLERVERPGGAFALVTDDDAPIATTGGSDEDPLA
jgi:hypothetical protein